MGKTQKTGNTAVSGVRSVNSGDTQRDAYINAYCKSAYKGATAEEATNAARSVAMPDYAETVSRASQQTGTVSTAESKYADRVINGGTEQSSAASKYADRVSSTTAQNSWADSGHGLYSPTTESDTDTDESIIDRLKDWYTDTFHPYKSETVYTGALDINTEQTEPKEVYRYPEEGGSFALVGNEPFTEEQKVLIDRINQAKEAGDDEEAKKLSDLLENPDEGYKRLQYSDSLPEGTEEYQPLDDAYSGGNITQYSAVRDEMLASGYDGEEIADHTAEQIRAAYTGQGDGKIDRSNAEKQLREYVGLSESDAHATVAWWWFDSYGGASEADTSGNGKLTMDELGTYCTKLMDDGEIDEEQASAIFEKAKPKSAKKTYSEWLAKYGKGA